ncbi:MAG: class I SAM-dependent methyltransferase [Magnetovibrio sp.]|nr:class I SAM-dependent methyltransferase [Magnetovibrio sp.]
MKTVNWDSLHKGNDSVPAYPSELVVRWMFRSFGARDSKKYKVLDLGGGGGRHSIFMAESGIDVTMADLSVPALNCFESWAKEKGIEANSVHCSADDLPFEDDLFDGILSFGVLYYLDPDSYERSLKEIYRVLKPCGHAFIYVKSPEDSRSKSSSYLGNHQYKLNDQGGESSWPFEEGSVLTLFPKKILLKMLTEFSSISIDRSSITRGGGATIEDEWLVYLQK